MVIIIQNNIHMLLMVLKRDIKVLQDNNKTLKKKINRL